MTITIRTVFLIFLFLVSVLLFLKIVSTTNGPHTYTIWTRLGTEMGEQWVEDAIEVPGTEAAYKVNAKEYSDTVIGKAVEGSVETDVDTKGLVNTKKHAAIDEHEPVEKKYERLLGCRKLPDILTIGFGKCGTVTLNKYLGVHPQIFVTHEENYQQFNKDSNVSVQEYTKNAECTPSGQLRLNKLGIHGIAEKTYKYVPNVRLLAIVREPVERAMSQYMMSLERGLISNQSNFDSLIASILDYNTPYHVKSSILFSNSRFIEKLELWITQFGLDNLHIVDGDTFAKYPVGELQKVEQFLGIKPFITDDQFVYNAEKRFYCIKENNDSKCMPSRKGRPHPQMSNETRTRLQGYFKPYNKKLFRTIGRNFSWNY